MVWEFVFMILILKIPIVYLCLVVWWAVRAEPRPLESAALPAPNLDEPPDRGWRRRLRTPVRRGPHGGPARTYPRTARATLAPTRARR